MTPSLHHILLPAQPLSGARYFLAGLALVVVKYLIDSTIARALLGRAWSPWDYLAPGAAVGMPAWGVNAAFFWTMLAVSIPFIAAGIYLTLWRLRTVGLNPALIALFFVPLVNFLFFQVIATYVPRKRREEEELPYATPAPGAEGPVELAYGRDDTSHRKRGFGRLIPAGELSSLAAGALMPLPVGVGLLLLGVHTLGSYGWGVFVGLPFVLAMLAVLIAGYHRPLKVSESQLAGFLATLAFGVGVFVFALEGLGCLIMLLPLAVPIACLGAAVGHSIHRSWHPSTLLALLASLPLIMGAERLAGPPAPVIRVTTCVEINAPPMTVWQNVVTFGQLPEPAEWIFKSGVAYPVRAEIQGSGVGAVRHCVFSTGPFVEPITAWEPGRLLKFDVTRNPPPMREWTFYSGVHPPHLENFLVSRGGEFRLIDLGGGRTRLEGTTWYQHHMWPAGYWRLWSDFIIHRIHGRVLNHVKTLSETGGVP